MSDRVDDALAKARDKLAMTSASCARNEHGMCQGHFTRGFNQGHGHPIAIQCACPCHKVAA